MEMSKVAMTIADAMALAVLRQDWVAAYALADKLQEQRDSPNSIHEQAAKIFTDRVAVPDGYAVFRWPEFQAFAKRLGFVWDLRTISATIELKEGFVVAITQQYQGQDMGGESVAVETTTMYNERFRTTMPATPREEVNDE